jgi:5-methylcytosine-specific restriction endonuclease McrA
VKTKSSDDGGVLAPNQKPLLSFGGRDKWICRVFPARSPRAFTCPQLTCRQQYFQVKEELFRIQHGVARSTVWTRGLQGSRLEHRREKARAAARRRGYTPARKAYKQKRRALIRNNPAETIDPRRVYDRDAWRCGLCRLVIDDRLKFPDPMCATLDHVVPIARGGGHTYGNVQAAHLRCNNRKGVRMEEVA